MARAWIAVLAFALALGGAMAPGSAQEDYPSAPISFLVPFPPGGGNDTLARVVTAKASELIGGTIVVENRPGAGGTVAGKLAADAKPDGYTLLQGNIAHAISMSMYKTPSFDLLKDLDAITLFGRTSYVLAIRKDLPVNSVEEFIAYAKERPGELNYGSSGVGGHSHLAMEIFKAKAGVDIVHIPYQGAAPSILDLVGGRLDCALIVMSQALPLIADNQVKALAVSSLERSELAPNLPTIAESGVPGYEASAWYGVMAPAGTPKPIADKLYEGFHAAVNDPAIKEKLTTMGFEVVGNTPDEFKAYLQSEVATWAEAVKLAGITPE